MTLSYERPPLGRPSQHEAKELTVRILDVAAEIFAKCGYHGASIGAIASKAKPPEAAPAGENQAIARAQFGTVLLVDDEDLVRESTAHMLTELGYEVFEAASAEAALELVSGGLVPRLLVTDQLMPGRTGSELARELRARQSDLPVLIVSGYADVQALPLDLPRLAKPFRKVELAQALSSLEAG